MQPDKKVQALFDMYANTNRLRMGMRMSFKQCPVYDT